MKRQRGRPRIHPIKDPNIPVKVSRPPTKPSEFVFVNGQSIRRPESKAGSKVLTVDEWVQAVSRRD